jgi:hypothetical protein
MKLPLTLIASGKTDAVEEGRFGEVGSHRTNHSEPEWMTTEAFQRWRVRNCDSVHRHEAMRQYVAELGIELSSIPPGLTDERQP